MFDRGVKSNWEAQGGRKTARLMGVSSYRGFELSGARIIGGSSYRDDCVNREINIISVEDSLRAAKSMIFFGFR